jgi:ketosteroid isomerase-like protein
MQAQPALTFLFGMSLVSSTTLVGIAQMDKIDQPQKVTQTAATIGPRTSNSRNESTQVAELVALTNDWTKAITRKDHAKLEELMAPDYSLYAWDGALRAPRAVWMDNLYNHLEIENYEHKGIAPRVYGDVANVTSIADWRGVRNGKPFNETVIVVDTWRRTGDRWQVVSRTTRVEPPVGL